MNLNSSPYSNTRDMPFRRRHTTRVCARPPSRWSNDLGIYSNRSNVTEISEYLPARQNWSLSQDESEQDSKTHRHTRLKTLRKVALVMHCCKAHARTDRKMGNSTPVKIVTPANFRSELCTRNYVVDGNYRANFGANRFSGGFSPSRWYITTLWLFDCPVMHF